MSLKTLALAILVFCAPVAALAADQHNWQPGVLTATERQRIKEGSTFTTNSDSSRKDRGNKTDYSETSTTTKSDNFENYQVYTIQDDTTVYVVSEHLLFPWSKPASIIVGKPVKFAVEKGSMYIFDDAGKQHKATVVSTSLKQ
jgi:hypothetical protein